MRPLTNFTLHAVLAAALVAFAATGAAGKEPHYYTIELTNASIAQTSGATGKDEKIPVLSFLWGLKIERTGASSGRMTAIASDPSDPAAGQATGKRQHKPLLMRGHYDSSAPPPRGSLTVLAGSGSCRVGARYPSVKLSGGGKTYVLQGVTVTSCGGASAAAGDGPLTEEVSFSYQTIKFQY